MKNMRLSGKQRQNLQLALIDAFPDKASLEQMLSYELDKNLDEIAFGGNLQNIVFNLIKVADAEGWLFDLIRAACKSNPGNAILRDLAQELMLITTAHPLDNSNEVPPKPPNQYKRFRRLTQQEYRQRQVLLDKVKNFWLKGVLEKSLYSKALIELRLEERPNAVQRPFNGVEEFSDQYRRLLPEGTQVIDVFNQMGAGRTLLILGESGSGKTITLLKLAQCLIAHTETDLSKTIPVVFNLSSWTNKRQSIAVWLVKELSNKYQVSEALGKNWIQNQDLILLLDGLDEVIIEHQEACIIAINEFIQTHGQTEIVICSRIQDYEALSTRLQLQGVILIQSLASEQINQYLDGVGEQLEGLKTFLEKDTSLQELAKSPLMLNVMALAYQSISIKELPQTQSLRELRQHLFNAYIERMFKRKKNNQQYLNSQAIQWLIWLAQRMRQESQTIFLIEQMQPRWLQANLPKWIYALSYGLIHGLIGGLIAGIGGLSAGLSTKSTIGLTGMMLWFGLLVGLSAARRAGLISMLWFCLITALINGLITGLIFGLSLGLSLGFYSLLSVGLSVSIFKLCTKLTGDLLELKLQLESNGNDIYPIETLKFSWFNAKSNLVFGILYGLPFGLIAVFPFGGFCALSFALVGVLICMLSGAFIGPTIVTRTIPNQGIWQSAKIAMLFTLITALLISLATSITNTSIALGISFALYFGLLQTKAGAACIKHFALRLVLHYQGHIPWNYAHFLDYATNRILLQKVGGGYIFIHRLLMEHFADMGICRDTRKLGHVVKFCKDDCQNP